MKHRRIANLDVPNVLRGRVFCQYLKLMTGIELDAAKVKMLYKLRTEAGKAIYKLRKSTVEPVFGIIKEVMGFRQFSLRGLAAAAGEWNLVCLAYNLKRLHGLHTA